jgi:hypothetical protein
MGISLARHGRTTKTASYFSFAAIFFPHPDEKATGNAQKLALKPLLTWLGFSSHEAEPACPHLHLIVNKKLSRPRSSPPLQLSNRADIGPLFLFERERGQRSKTCPGCLSSAEPKTAATDS